MEGRGKRPHPGRMRLEIVCKYKGEVVWSKAGPANIVYGLYEKFLIGWKVPRE